MKKSGIVRFLLCSGLLGLLAPLAFAAATSPAVTVAKLSTPDSHGGVGVGATETIDRATAIIHELVMGENPTLTVEADPDLGDFQWINVELVQDGTGGWTPAWATGDEPDPVPVVSTAASTRTKFTLYTVDGGSNWRSSSGAQVKHFAISFDPAAVCDGDVNRLFLQTVGDHASNGLLVTEWSLSFEADPTTEADLDLKYADAFIGVANATVMDVLDTTTGTGSETTTANINSGALVANGKVMYLEFGTAYTETGHQCIFEMWYIAL